MSELIERARAFALAAHEGQLRKGEAAEPYAVHVAEVADLVAAHGGDAVAVAAAWLHDVVEDCGVALAALEAGFGADVAAVVAELTDDKTLPKPERKARQVQSAPTKSPRAALVKACDKTSNVRALRLSPPVAWDGARRAAYLDWAETVVAALPGGADPARALFLRELALTRAALAL